MSGSKLWFNYLSDNGQTYAILLDESNTKAVNPSGATGPVTASSAVPRNIKPRYANFRSVDGLYNRRVVLLTPAAYAALTPGQSYTPPEAASAVVLSSARGEQINLPKAQDTGLQD